MDEHAIQFDENKEKHRNEILDIVLSNILSVVKKCFCCTILTHKNTDAN